MTGFETTKNRSHPVRLNALGVLHLSTPSAATTATIFDPQRRLLGYTGCALRRALWRRSMSGPLGTYF
jgi:hypothetical protein